MASAAANLVPSRLRPRQGFNSFLAQLPAAVSLNVTYDRSEMIRASVADVKFKFVLTMALVVLVILLFLRNLRATLIPALAIPMSLVGTFAVLMVWRARRGGTASSARSMVARRARDVSTLSSRALRSAPPGHSPPGRRPHAGVREPARSRLPPAARAVGPRSR